MFSLSPELTALLSGPLVALAGMVLLKVHAPNPVKTVVVTILSAVAFLVTNATNDSGIAVFSWKSLAAVLLTWISATASYQHGFKVFGLEYKVLPNKGI